MHFSDELIKFGPALGYANDEELVEELVAGTRPDLVQSVEQLLWLYGWRVLRGKVRDLSILRVSTGLPRLWISEDDLRTLHDSAEVREELIVDTLVLAVPFMIGQLHRGKWNPGRSSCLGTYFTSVCASKFRDVYKTWHRARVERMHELSAQDDHAETLRRASTPDASDVVVDRFRLRAIIRNATLEERMICAGLLLGKPQSEIAEELGITARAVEGRIYRLRQRTWEDLGAKPLGRKIAARPRRRRKSAAK